MIGAVGQPSAPGDDRGTRRPTADGWGILLPSTWWTVDLREAEARRRSVAALVEQQTGRADVHASLRADLRRHLEGVAEQAAAAGGVLMAVSLMVAGGLPVPATMTVYRLPVASDLAIEGMAQIEAVFREQGGHDALELAEGRMGPVLRRVSRRSGTEDLGASTVTMLLVDYWLEPGDGRGLVSFTFSSPLVEARDALLELFDAVVASVDTVGQGR